MARDVRHIALSWKQTVAIVLLISAAILSPAAISEPRNPREDFRTALWIICTCCVTVSVFLFAWHIWSVRRQDVFPDILAQLFGPDQIFEFGSLHFCTHAVQIGSHVRITVAFQNVYDDVCTGQLRLIPKGNMLRIPCVANPLQIRLAAAEVVASWRDFSIPATASVSFGLDGHVSGNKWRRVRYKRRTAVRTESATTFMMVVGLLSGHFIFAGGSRIDVAVNPPERDPDPSDPMPWHSVSLWTPEEPRDPQTIAELLQKIVAA